MSVLLLDTSCAKATLALIDVEGTLLAEIELTEMRRHAEALADACDALFEKTGLSFSDLSAIGVGAGPGSFVGVRVGLSTCKGWAMGAGVPLVGIEGLFALAQGAPEKYRWTLACIDARRGELYCALYENSAMTSEKQDVEFKWVERKEAAARSPEAVFELLKAMPELKLEEMCVVGTGLSLLHDVVKLEEEQQVLLEGPSGEMLAAAFLKAVKKGVHDEAPGLVPRYLRKPDAMLPKLRGRPKGA